MKLLKSKKFYFLAVLVLVVLLLSGAMALYFINPFGRLSQTLFRYFPYPVAKVSGDGFITSQTLIADTLALKRFYLSQDFAAVGMRVDFETEEGRLRMKVKEKDVLDKLVENKIVEKVANDAGIKVTRQDAEREVNRKVTQLGDRQMLQNNLDKLYGWTIDEFRDKVVISELYMQKLSEKYFQEHGKDNPSYDKAQKAQKALKPDGSNFEEVAKEYSDGESALSGGELGWFSKDQLVPEVADAVYLSKPGQISDIIQSSLGYHIVLVQEFRDAENQSTGPNVLGNQGDKIKEVKLKQVFIKGGGFIDWLKEQKKQTDVTILMKDYRWDKGEGRVKFSHEAMNQAEERLRLKSDGDPSMQ